MIKFGRAKRKGGTAGAPSTDAGFDDGDVVNVEGENNDGDEDQNQRENRENDEIMQDPATDIEDIDELRLAKILALNGW